MILEIIHVMYILLIDLFNTSLKKLKNYLLLLHYIFYQNIITIIQKTIFHSNRL